MICTASLLLPVKDRRIDFEGRKIGLGTTSKASMLEGFTASEDEVFDERSGLFISKVELEDISELPIIDDRAVRKG